MQGTHQLRPLAIGEIVDAAVSMARNHFRELSWIVAPIVVPLQLLAFFVGLLTIDDPEELFSGIATSGSGRAADAIDVAPLVGNVAISLLGGLAILLTIAACTRAVSNAYLDRSPDAGESLRFALRRMPSLLWIMLLGGFLLLLAFLALVIPGIWLAVSWSMAIPVLLVEGIRGRKALARSFRLVRGRWWPVLAALALGAILAAIVQSVLGFAVGLFVFAGGSDSVALAVLLNAVTTALSAIITTPFLAAIYTIVYYDLRVRKEGLDLELLADDVGSRGSQAAGG